MNSGILAAYIKVSRRNQSSPFFNSLPVRPSADPPLGAVLQ